MLFEPYVLDDLSLVLNSSRFYLSPSLSSLDLSHNMLWGQVPRALQLQVLPQPWTKNEFPVSALEATRAYLQPGRTSPMELVDLSYNYLAGNLIQSPFSPTAGSSSSSSSHVSTSGSDSRGSSGVSVISNSTIIYLSNNRLSGDFPATAEQVAAVSDTTGKENGRGAQTRTRFTALIGNMFACDNSALG